MISAAQKRPGRVRNKTSHASRSGTIWRHDRRERIQLGAQDLRRRHRIVRHQPGLQTESACPSRELGEEAAHTARESDLGELWMQEDPPDAQPLGRGQLHLREP